MWEKNQGRVVVEFPDFARGLLVDFSRGGWTRGQLTKGVEAGYGDG